MRPRDASGASVERRRAERRLVRRVNLVSPVRGEVLDIGRGGMRIETDRALTVGARTYFVIGQPPELLVRISGLVRWCRFDGSRPTAGDGEARAVFRAGVVFLGIAGELPEGRG
ncbi:MAG: PilZ domain-containing protein [Thermoanaerobaculia bacterium]|nr:PilZ domain-containing protein [Thermoanaerobaculia bacterium]